MDWFANLIIRTKLLLLLLPLGMIVIGALLFASTEMWKIDARYNELLRSKVQAIMAVTRSNQRIIQINQKLYELIAERDADRHSRIEGEIEKTVREYHDLMDEAKKFSPQDASRIADVDQLFENFIIETTIIRKRVQASGDSDLLEFMRARVTPLFALTRAASTKLTDSMRETLENASATALSDTGRAIRLTWLAVSFGLVLSLAMALYIAQFSIVRPLQRLRDAIRDVAGGRHDRDVPCQELANEVGEMARDLGVLQQGAVEREVQSFVKAEAAAAAETLQIAQDYQAFAGTLFARLGAAIDIVHGELYLGDADGRRFVRVGGFAVDNPDGAKTVALGEGLVGQCALDGRPKELSVALDESGVGVGTGLGTLRPKNLLIWPVRSQERISAVLELATASPVSPRSRALLEALMGVAAVNLEILSGNLATRELLEKTQQQAESLAVSEMQLIARKDQLQSALGEVEAVRGQLVEMSDSLPIGVFQIVHAPDAGQRYVFASRQVERLIGVSPQELLADPANVWRHVDPQDVEQAKQMIAAILAGVSRKLCKRPWLMV